MAMLAERKQKIKWVINPTKKPLWKTNEEGGVKFGMQLMEKMGWTPGKGLGLHEQGTPEPIRLGYKGDTKGMGFKDADDDWIQHQDEFNSLLSSLANGETNNVSIAKEDCTKYAAKSLEEKSKNSKARVHYQKFTRGKDLSRYSENDLACILGSRKKKFKDENEKEKEIQEELNYQTEENTENTFGVTTINGGSITDYFRKKLGTTYRPPILQENEDSSNFEKGYQPEESELISKKKSKSKKKKEKTQYLEENLNSNVGTVDDDAVEQNQDQDQKQAKRKKKKKERGDPVSESDPLFPPTEESSESVKAEKSLEDNALPPNCEKKKKKEKTQYLKENSNGNDRAGEDDAVDQNQDQDQNRTKKKKKRKEHKVSVSENDPLPPPYETSESVKPEQSSEDNVLLPNFEKKKKKRKKDVEVENEEDTQLKKRKKHKSVQEELQEEFLEPVSQPDSDELNKDRKKKKKKKAKKKFDLEAETPNENLDTENLNIPEPNRADFSVVNESAFENEKKFIRDQHKTSEKNLSRNKIFDLICEAQIDKFKGSNLEGLNGYGLWKPKR